MSPRTPLTTNEIRVDRGERLVIPPDVPEVTVVAGRRSTRLTNLRKLYFPEAGINKRDLLQYYADLAAALLPHLKNRAMVMKRYPSGIHGKHFFMKRTPAGAPDWVECCRVEHASGDVIAFPMIQDIVGLLWVVNLGCIDLNPWYSRCDDIDRPDFLNFDLDPVEPAQFARVREVALHIRDRLRGIGARSFVKTTGSRGLHIYVPITRGPLQKEVWGFAKSLALAVERDAPKLVTAEYRVAKRPAGRVLVDYNQNAWGRTLASVYSLRPKPAATVSTPVSWEEVEGGVEIDDFTILNVSARMEELGDLWKPLLQKQSRFELRDHL